MVKAVGVFCASSERMDEACYRQAEELGRLLARFGMDLVYGGGAVGMMGAVARAVHEQGGRVVGVIPELLMAREVAYKDADEMIVTRDLMQRKEIMIERSDAFAILPGGFGTLDEALEVITLRQLGASCKPVYFLNIHGYFDGFFAFVQQMRTAGGIAPRGENLYQVVADVTELAERLAGSETADRP